MNLSLPTVAALLAITLPALAAAPRLTWFPTPLSPQLANYDIQVTLDPVQHSLTKGRETIRWKNGTANPTSELKFHLYQNAFSSNRSGFMSESGGEMRGIKHQGDRSMDYGYMTVSALSVTYPGGAKQDLTALMILGGAGSDGEKLDDTVMSVALPLPVGPGESLEISLNFTTKLPRIFARSGFFRNYHLAGQWFPKLGVLEDAGWNCHAYHATSEFYSDYGVYDVEIIAPKNFIIAATGEKVQGGDGKPWRFHAEDVHDFAFAADPNFVEPLEGKYTTADGSHSVRVQVFYHDYQKGFARRHLDSAIKTLEWFEKHVGPYPYPVLTIVDPAYNAGGSGGMEYPTFVTTLSITDLPRLSGVKLPEVVTVHEVGHQWFYGLLGSNEFEEAWLDEGLNQFSENRIMDEHYGGVIDFYGVKLGGADQSRGGYVRTPGLDPTLQKAWEYASEGSYGNSTYSKSATFMHTLMNQIGEAKLDAGLRLYYQRFAFKHPRTGDFIATLSEAAGQDLNPFFDTWLKSTRTLDYKVRKIQSERVDPDTGWFKDKQGELRFRSDGEWEEKGSAAKKRPDKARDEKVSYLTTLIIQREGAAMLPLEFVVEFGDGSKVTGVWDGAGAWKKFEWTRSCERKKTEGCRYRSVKLDPERKLTVDLDRLNNGKQRKGDSRPSLKAATRISGALLLLLDLMGGLL